MIKKITMERFSLISSKPFDQVLAVVNAGIGHPDMAEFGRSQAFTARRDMSAVLNVAGRPKLLSGVVVALIEKCFESFQDEGFVPRFNRLIHFFRKPPA